MADILDDNISRFRYKTQGGGLNHRRHHFGVKRWRAPPDAFTLALYIYGKLILDQEHVRYDLDAVHDVFIILRNSYLDTCLTITSTLNEFPFCKINLDANNWHLMNKQTGTIWKSSPKESFL